jgi:PQQ-like domain
MSLQRSVFVGMALAILAAWLPTPAHAAPGDRGVIWASRYPAGDRLYTFATAEGMSPDGSLVFVTGAGPGLGPRHDGSKDFVTVAYDTATGARQWVARFAGPTQRKDIPLAMKVSPDGSRVFLTGFTQDGPGGMSRFDYATVAYDAGTGRQLWVATYDGPGYGDDRSEAIDVSADGARVFVTGSSQGVVGSHSDMATVAYNAWTGTQLWAARYDDPAHGYDSGEKVAASPDGSTVYVTGDRSAPSGLAGEVTLAYSAAAGRRRWIRVATGRTLGFGSQFITVRSDGSLVFVAGAQFRANQIPTIVARDAERRGAVAWVARLPKIVNAGTTSIATSPDGSRVFLSAVNDSSGRVTIAAFDAASGARIWTSSARFGYVNLTTGLTLAADGSKLFVCGTDASALGVAAFDPASGARLWRGRRDFNGDPLWPAALASSPDGSRVFVTGTGSDSGNPSHFVTVAFGSSHVSG